MRRQAEILPPRPRPWRCLALRRPTTDRAPSGSQGSWFANEFDTILLVLLTGIPFPGLSLGGSTSKTDFPTPSLATRLFKPMLRRSWSRCLITLSGRPSQASKVCDLLPQWAPRRRANPPGRSFQTTGILAHRCASTDTLENTNRTYPGFSPPDSDSG